MKCKQGTSSICTLPRDIPQCFDFYFKLTFQSSSVLLFFLLEEPIDPSGVLKGALIVWRWYVKKKIQPGIKQLPSYDYDHRITLRKQDRKSDVHSIWGWIFVHKAAESFCIEVWNTKYCNNNALMKRQVVM